MLMISIAFPTQTGELRNVGHDVGWLLMRATVHAHVDFHEKDVPEPEEGGDRGELP